MTFATFSSSHIQLRNDRISDEDADRQARATQEVLKRFDRQPGVVLADEVGMGKTFVALAASLSILLERPDSGPVVVMSPSSLRYKWPKDWKVFVEKCIVPSLRSRFRAATADSGVTFLKLLDDPPSDRAHVIFLTHGAFHRTIGDGFTKLALIKRAFKGRSSLAEQRRAFGRWAGRILWLEKIARRSPDLLGDLLDRPYDRWLRVIHRADARFNREITDDPVPRHLAEVLEGMDGRQFASLVEALREVPLRESSALEERLRDVRRLLTQEMETVWQEALRRAKFRSPLIVLDEAHHVKNPATQLASLFMTPESDAESRYVAEGGPLAGKFERMLFLTATPFQLGHAELIRVLERFGGIAWDGELTPELTRREFENELITLGRTLDDAQSAALRLERAWSRLTSAHVGIDVATPGSVDTWWESAQNEVGEGIVAQIAEKVRRTRSAMKRAESALAPWVLRHVRANHLPGHRNIPRRKLHLGAAIKDHGDGSSGLDITPQVLLPFLLAGRAQGLLASCSRGRALFAEGLASSFEAYLETRSSADGVEEDSDLDAIAVSPELDWYLDKLDQALPKGDRDARSAHPKIRATAERAVALWGAGEKVLIFCHYRATGRALRQHISSLLHREILMLGQRRLPRRSLAQVQEVVDTIGTQFFDDDRLRDRIVKWLETVVRPFGMNAEHENQVIEAVRRFLRTPSFLVRYFPLDAADPSGAIIEALETRHGDESMRERIEHFCRFLADRCIPEERTEFLEALRTIQTGTHFGKDVTAAFDPAEGSGTDDAAILLPNVRLANGLVRDETRRRLLLTFNTPLFPEILIASSVLAEGVDLHLHCRYIIHHDLCWNPSTLEQRSGRVDRIGCRAERVNQPINLYLPYVAATQDEKMFRVVRDRERWFQIVMGEKYEVDEATTDRRAQRIPLPTAVQTELSMRLHP